ncbi:universal stress protein [Thermovibrio ammonificans]|jgi:nucleotide-binding universal stress UspA family protein|uniref:UspA domain-containing protein n=1 Tax=Thermovibrio ammonificans (strain DSM 15698 / JCM 12110 / HB-1) TaxID=648996 RepID=E8T453_THEA1|nr:universal stress protein [Thermovibrio ammonificans]ADU97382.1 hypothetical protein Theam_1419 [Thermovibrio ammonificans HB-1]
MLFQKVLYPFDMRKSSLSVKPYILKLKEAGCKEVHMLYVLIPSDWGLLPRDEYDCEEKLEVLKGALDEGYGDAVVRIYRRMKEVAKEFEEAGISVRVVLVPGELDETIAEYAKKHNISLVTLGITSESLSFFRVGRLLDIIKEVQQPVLIVKAPEEDGKEEL